MATATWSKLLSADILQRSSQIISLTPDNVYIFGGELRPREPRDNDVHVVQTSPPRRLPSMHSNALPTNLQQTPRLP